MNIFIIIVMLYAGLLIFAQVSYWGVMLILQTAELLNKNKQLLFIVSIGLVLTLFLFH